MAGIYLHIPFCKQACHYCDFHFSTNQSTRTALIAALQKELFLQKDYLQGEVIDTVYFGGGTPSLLRPSELADIMGTIRSLYTINPQAEVSFEANPDDLTPEKLRDLFIQGVNRLSIGIQSFDDGILKFFNRAHTTKQAISCMKEARAAGFSNISLDLMYAIPGQSHAQWESNIEQALALQPEHISSYTLTIEEKTAFGKWARSGKLQGVDDEFAAEEFEILMNKLGKAGYQHYEISNFSKPDYHSRHNSNYWKQHKYLGIGPSAHSYNKESRQYNLSNNALYTKSLAEGTIPFEKEVLTISNKINEYIFTSLRTSWGCSLEYLKTELGYDLLGAQQNYMRELFDRQLITINGETICLTHQGKFLADQIASDLFIVA